MPGWSATMTSPLRKFLLKSSSGDVIVKREIRRAKSDSASKMQIIIRSHEPIKKGLYWDLPPETSKTGLPTKRHLITVLKSPFVHKKAREQFHVTTYKQMLGIEAKSHELSKKFFWLKRQRIFGAQFEVLFSFKTRLDKEKLNKIIHPGLKDFSQDDKLEEESVIVALNSLAEEGFFMDAVEASINSIESSFTGSFSHGLALMLRSVSVEALKARVDKEGLKALSTNLIEKLILSNPHRPMAEIQVDSEKTTQYICANKQKLEKLKENMTEEDLAVLSRLTRDLRLKQDTNQPSQAIKDVPMKVGDIDGVKVLQHDLVTNDVLYADIAFDLSSLKPELYPLVPLFCRSLLGMGTKDLNFVQLNELIRRKTGGISVYPFTSSKQGSKDPVSHIIVRSSAMSANTQDLFNLIGCVLQEVEFTNQKRFKRFVSESKATLENQLREGGHSLAAARMNAKLNHAGWISEQMGGISYLEFLKELEGKIEEQWSEISMSLEEIRVTLLLKKNCVVNLTCDGKNLKEAETYLRKFINFLPSNSPVGVELNARLLSLESEAIVVPTKVNYVGKAANIYESGYELKGSAYVISKYISNTWLWDKIRVGGGAFGAVCDFDTRSGVFSFLSYRDPNLLKTLDVYDGTSDFLHKLEMDDDTLRKAINGAIGDIDSYQLPNAKGYSSLLRYLSGVSEEERKARREEILATRSKDFKEFAGVIDGIKDKGVVVAVASQNQVDAANQERSSFFQVI